MSENAFNTPYDILNQFSGPIRFRMTNAYLFVAVLQKNREALCCFIAALLHLKRGEIHSLEILNPIILGQDIGKKDCVLDLLVLLNDETKVNLEIQVENEGNWDDRGIYYLSQNLCDLKSGDDYAALKRMVQIGILDFNFPAGNREFYQEYVMMNKKTHRIFSDKMSINVLCLNQLENASQEDRESGLYEWAKVFKATTWEELKVLSEKNKVIQETIVTMAELTDDEKIRQQCLRREKYERDRIQAHNYGIQQGLEQGLAQGIDDGIRLLSELIQKLLSAGRQAEIEKAVSDEACRNALLKEFNLK